MLFTACLKETAFLSEGTSNYVYEIAYEEETNTFQEIPEGKTYEQASIMQQLASVPLVERQKVHIGILADGSSEWEITQMKPQEPFDISKNLSSQTAYRTVLKNDMAYYFNKVGKLEYTQACPTPDFSDFLQQIKTNKNRSSFKKAEYDSTYTVTTINDSIIEISKIIQNPEDNFSDMLGKRYVAQINTKYQLTLEEAIYDENDELIYVKYNSYSDKGEVPIPVFSKTQLQVSNSLGEKNFTTTISQHDNIKITNNLD